MHRLAWIGLACVAGIAGRMAGAQDAQYWTIAYGTRAQLLGGVVIGSAVDIGTTYYDPGTLALTGHNDFAVAGSAFQFSSVHYENGLGLKHDLGTSSVAGLPSVLAGEIKIGGHDRLAYSFLTRQALDLDIAGRDLPLDSVITAPNLPYGSATIELHQHVSEYWAGVTYAHPFTQHVAIGVTPYIAVRNQNSRLAADAIAVGSSGAAGVVAREYDFSYTDWRALAKIGIGFSYPHVAGGLVLTTPGLELLGSGNVGRTITTINQGVAGTGPTAPVVATDFQPNLPVTYRSPLSIGLGASYTLGPSRTPTTIYVSGEWFNSVGAYAILTPAALVPATGGAPLTGSVQEELRSITNGGIGLEHRFNAKLSGYASLRTDQSALGEPAENNALVARWDLRHVTGGASWSLGRSDFVVGADVAFGARTQDASAATTANGAPIIPAGARVGYFSTTVIVGFRLAGP